MNKLKEMGRVNEWIILTATRKGVSIVTVKKT